MAALEGSDYCWTHDPSVAAKRAAARRKGGIASRAPVAQSLAIASDASETGDPSREAIGVSLRDVGSLQTILERIVADELGRPSSSQRSRTVVYALQLAVKALETGQIEERIAALENRVDANDRRERLTWARSTG
jgi:hypothetical protein